MTTIGLVPADVIDHVRDRLAPPARSPHGRPSAQPFNTGYVGANVVDADTPRRWCENAQAMYNELVATPDDLVALRLDAGVDPATLHQALLDRLAAAPLEDLRIDFEDGYGWRPDDEEDEAARRAGGLAAQLLVGDHAPSRIGIRCKPFEPASVERAVRTIELFAQHLAAANVDDVVVTLPKVTNRTQVDLLVDVLESVEQALGIAHGSFSIELQIEQPAAVISANGLVALPAFVDAAAGRCLGLHYGTYDYAAELLISPAGQSLDHPVAHFAKNVMQIIGASLGIDVVDGSTNIVPAGDRETMAAAIRDHVALVHDGLHRGLYQGWDLDPRHLVGRWLGITSFFLAGLPVVLHRLEQLADRAPQRSSNVLEEPATLRTINGFVQRAIRCGLVDEALIRRLEPPWVTAQVQR